MFSISKYGRNFKPVVLLSKDLETTAMRLWIISKTYSTLFKLQMSRGETYHVCTQLFTYVFVTCPRWMTKQFTLHIQWSRSLESESIHIKSHLDSPDTISRLRTIDNKKNWGDKSLLLSSRVSYFWIRGEIIREERIDRHCYKPQPCTNWRGE